MVKFVYQDWLIFPENQEVVIQNQEELAAL